MWSIITACLLSVAMSEPRSIQDALFTQEQIIFSSDFNITSIIVPADSNYLMQESGDIPNVFFTVQDPESEGGSCIYVLQGFAAYEVLEGGTDTTSDFGADPSVYFGTRNGVYKYYPETLSAKKFGVFRDDVKQLQKANGTDVIYILTAENKLFKLLHKGTVRERVSSVPCATEFVLDTSNNIYYISCGENLPHIVNSDGNMLSPAANILEDFNEIKLIRPAFLMDHCIPFIGDGQLYMLYANGTSEKKDFTLQERPSAYSVDAAVYIIVALDGKIYEFNIMDVLLKSMFGMADVGDLTRIVLEVVDKTRTNNKDIFHSYHTFIK